MTHRRRTTSTIMLTFEREDGPAWSLRLSADCLRFIGRYRRVEGFDIDAVALVEGLRRAG